MRKFHERVLPSCKKRLFVIFRASNIRLDCYRNAYLAGQPAHSQQMACMHQDRCTDWSSGRHRSQSKRNCSVLSSWWSGGVYFASRHSCWSEDSVVRVQCTCLSKRVDLHCTRVVVASHNPHYDNCNALERVHLWSDALLLDRDTRLSWLTCRSIRTLCLPGCIAKMAAVAVSTTK
eukprot:scpid65567/ scgid8081/ 